jgi:hypothetical protein
MWPYSEALNLPKVSGLSSLKATLRAYEEYPSVWPRLL